MIDQELLSNLEAIGAVLGPLLHIALAGAVTFSGKAILVKLASIRAEMPLDKAVATARDAGRKYIKVASQELLG